MDPFGGSDSTTVTLTVTQVNEPPVLGGGDLEEDGYPENMTAVTTFTAMDPEGDGTLPGPLRMLTAASSTSPEACSPVQGRPQLRDAGRR